jgi:hypothetical protein
MLMTRGTKLEMRRVPCSACGRDDIPVFPLPYVDGFGEQVNLCEVCIKTGWETYQRYLKWFTCRIVGSSGRVKGLENLKGYKKLKAMIELEKVEADEEDKADTGTGGADNRSIPVLGRGMADMGLDKQHSKRPMDQQGHVLR